eukprot:10215511-Ditylum_brightwellii.AAC.1
MRMTKRVAERTRMTKKDERQNPTSSCTPAGITKDTYSSSMHKFMRFYFVNHQFDARNQKHYLWSYL